MKYLLFPFIFIFILSCSFNKVVKHHGVHFLEKKHQKLMINTSNKNDIIKLLGEPSSKSTFDNDVWIYIERKISTGKIYYLGKEKLEVVNLERGFAWLDTGTVESLIETSLFIQTIEKRQGLKVSCPEEIVWRKKLIDDEQLNKIIRTMENSPYKQYLSQILNENLINSSD